MIADVVDRRRFIDVQIHGLTPLVARAHFPEGNGGVWIIDRVQYALPLGPFGRMACGTFVRRRLEQIFDFRREVLEGLLPAARTIQGQHA
jgi:ligand-binding SRPBCC domain-containing protein